MMGLCMPSSFGFVHGYARRKRSIRKNRSAAAVWSSGRGATLYPKGKPHDFWRVQSEDGFGKCVVEVSGYRGLHLEEGFRGFVFDGETPVVIREASFKDGGKT